MMTKNIGEVGAVGMSDEAAMGYYVVEWLSEPYSLQVDMDSMAGVIGTGKRWWMQFTTTGCQSLHIGTQNQRRRQWSRLDMY